MAHPDQKRQGNEKGQREHAGKSSAASDAGIQSHSQGARGPGPTLGTGPTPTSGAGPEAASGADGSADEARRRNSPGKDGTSPAVPPGNARDLEGRGSMSDRGLEVSGGRDRPAAAGAGRKAGKRS
jgi:hypothetical protein